MNGLQMMIDEMNRASCAERAKSQLTLGMLIDSLHAMPPHAQVANLCNPGSYRGYYSDLYFKRGEGTRPASELLDVARGCMGEVFTGYKGGDFQMGRSTPLWVAEYGDCGLKLMAVNADGTIETAEDE